MSVFDNLVSISEKGEIVYSSWIEWDHFMIPNKPEWFRELLRNLMVTFGHCYKCTALDGCYLCATNMPMQPLHENCDCRKKNVSYLRVKNKARAECDLRKFTEYVFKDLEGSKGKNRIFHSLGFDIDDSSFLQKEFCRQAVSRYLNGDYLLNSLDRHGQRLSIKIILKGAAFYSGWRLCPEGEIKNITPFARWVE